MKKLLFLLLLTTSVLADSAGLSWDAPVEREDGTAVSQDAIGGFRIYTTEGVQVGSDIPADARAFSVPVKMMGQSVYMTSIDTDGRESTVPSKSVVIPVNTYPLKAPSVTVTFTISGN